MMNMTNTTPAAAISTNGKNTQIQGAKIWMEYRPEKKEIFARCLTDLNNEPAFYTTHKRGIAKAWDALVLAIGANPDLTLAQAMHVLSGVGMRYHYWCMVD